jgi:hypothetical protein
MRNTFAARRVKNRTGKIAAVAAVFILTGLGLTFRTLSGSATGTIDNSAASISSAPASQGLSKVTTKYIVFEYPDSFRGVAVSKPSPPQLASFDYVTNKLPLWELAIGVRSLSSGNLEDDGSYHMRNSSPSRYKLEPWSVNDKSVEVFSDQTESYSKAAFIAGSGKMVTISLSGSGDKAIMQAVQMEVLKSLQWQP